MDDKVFEKQISRVAADHRINAEYKAEVYEMFKHMDDSVFVRVVDAIMGRKGPQAKFKPHISDWPEALRMVQGVKRDQGDRCTHCNGMMFNQVWVRFPDGSEGQAAQPCRICHPMRHEEIKPGWTIIPWPEELMMCGCPKAGKAQPVAVEAVSDEPEYFE